MEPIKHFAFNPADPSGAEFNSLRKLARRFKSRNMMWRVQHELLHLALPYGTAIALASALTVT